MSDADPTADAFDSIGHPARLSILEALLEVRRSEDDPHVRFTDLRDMSDIDDTGRFNYHLDELRGTFVRKTDDGYRLSTFGHRLLAPMVAGLYDPDRSLDPVEAPGECHECGEPLRIRAGESKLQVVCEAGHVVNQGLIGYPGAIADRSAADAAAALGLLNVQGVELAVAGVCPICHGPVDGRVSRHEHADAYAFRAPCDTCGNQFATTVGSCVTTHPAVVGFLDDHGVDVRRTAPWDLAFRQPGAGTAVSEDPLRVQVDVEAGDEALSVVVDETGSVVSTERREA